MEFMAHTPLITPLFMIFHPASKTFGLFDLNVPKYPYKLLSKKVCFSVDITFVSLHQFIKIDSSEIEQSSLT